MSHTSCPPLRSKIARVNRAIGFARAFLFCALVPALLSAEVRIEVDELPGDRWRITYLDLQAEESFRFARETFYPPATLWPLMEPATRPSP